MRTFAPLLSVLLFASSIHAQQPLGLTFDQLREYEGIYEYLDTGTVEIAASPRDHQLYAILKESKYLLKPLEKDVFVNNSGEKVIFLRDNAGTVNSYSLNERTFSFLKKNTGEKKAWYARETQGKKYVYKKTLKPKLNDGIEIGSIGGSALDRKNIQLMIERVVDGTYPDVHSILLLRDNKLVVEEYFYEYNRNTLHQMRSATKSVISALIGIAMGKGLIKGINEPVLSYFPEYGIADSTGLKKSITIRHLLTNQSGFDCDISIDSSAGNENIMGLSEDWVKFTLDLPMLDTPGTRGRYCSGNVIVLGRILEKASGMKLDEFARENLFKPIGISQFKWDFTPGKSSAETFCQLYMRPRDMAKFGLLYLNNGSWRGKQVIPPGWIRESTEEHSTVNETSYGYLWWRQWLNVAGRRYDGIAAKGNGGQRIYMFPEYNLLAVITGGSFNRDSPSDLMLINHVLPKLEKRQ